MRVADMTRLVILAAIWGASFLFMRIVSPVLGPSVTADSRVLIGGLFLVAIFAVRGPSLHWRRHWRRYAIIGIVNSAVPFLLYAFAALHIPASYSAILNSTAPLFGMVLSAVWLAERPSGWNLLGVLLGMAGVGMITGLGPIAVTSAVLAAVAACLGATLCYAIAGVYMRLRASDLGVAEVAGASQLVAGLVLLPAAVAFPPRDPITPLVAGCALALALLCSAVAYLLYFRLLADCGPTRALTVTFLIPVFGLLWGMLFLGEAITAGMLAGCGLVMGGTALVVRRPAPVPQAAVSAESPDSARP
jgi:drug/metabolite transporter (DMT)-like permease